MWFLILGSPGPLGRKANFPFVRERDLVRCHSRMALTRTSETIPVSGGRMLLGTWQGIYLFEHRRASHTREIIVTVMGV